MYTLPIKEEGRQFGLWMNCRGQFYFTITDDDGENLVFVDYMIDEDCFVTSSLIPQIKEQISDTCIGYYDSLTDAISVSEII